MATKKSPANAGPGDIFDESNRLPRDLAEGWFKFENVGDKVGGEVLDMFETPAKDGMPAQRVFTVKQDDGTITNVPLKRTAYILSRTDMLQNGDMMGVRFDKEVPSRTKGHRPAKSMVIFSKLVGPRTNSNAAAIPTPTVAEADDFDLPDTN